MLTERLVEQNHNWLYYPRFADDWKSAKLYALAEWTNGMAFRNIHFSEVGRPVIKIAELKNGISGQTKFTSAAYAPEYFVSPGDMLFAWSGQPQTSIDVFWWRGPDGWLNQHIFKVEPKESECDFDFFYYLLKYLNPNFVAIATNKQTTGLGHVTKRDLENVTVGVPPLAEQKAIAHILGTLDDKIELNRQMNRTLEDIARALFQSWFVDFDPVHAKIRGEPPAGRGPSGRAAAAALFPSEFEESELGLIPKGWRVGRLGDITSIQNGYAFKSREWKESGIPVVKIGSVKPGIVDMSSVSYIASSSAEKYARYRLEVGDLLIGLTGYVGEVGLVPPVTPQPLLNQRVGKFILPGTSDSELPYLYCLTRAPEFKLSVEGQAHGTAQANVSPKAILSLPLVIPPLSPREQFGSLVSPFLKMILGNYAESQTLAELRDTLLPKLMSGELRVPEAIDLSDV
jgi:type I restriction enzyme, S subunit